MANLQHLKASRVQILNAFPGNDFGKDGDIACANINGKGAYLCIKNNGRWFVADKLNDISQLDKPKMENLKVDSLAIRNAKLDTSKQNGNFTLDAHGDIELNTDGGQVAIKDGSASHFLFDCDNTKFSIYDDANANDIFYISIGAEGITTLRTTDANTTVAHITLQPDGDLILDPVSQKTIINATDSLYFDGGTHTSIRESSDDTLSFVVGGTNLVDMIEASTNQVNINSSELSIDAAKKLFFDGGGLGDTYITESSADVLDVKVGGDMIFQITESGADGNTIDIDNACIGFTQLEPTYDASNTVVDFRLSNKQNLTFGSGSITNIQLRFPLVSGNFQLLIKQDGTGSRTITNYKVYEFDESSADGSAAVVFAGGSNPTLTTDANHVDILSFYWDADNEIAYGVATLDFQF